VTAHPPPTQTLTTTAAQRAFTRLVQQVAQHETRVLVEEDGTPVAALVSPEDLARLTELDAAPLPAPKRRGRAQPVTEDDALFELIGIGDSGIPGGVSGKKHAYLARSYRPS